MEKALPSFIDSVEIGDIIEDLHTMLKISSIDGVLVMEE